MALDAPRDASGDRGRRGGVSDYPKPFLVSIERLDGVVIWKVVVLPHSGVPFVLDDDGSLLLRINDLAHNNRILPPYRIVVERYYA